MVVPLGSEGSRIPVLIGFMVDPIIRICRSPLSKYPPFISLGNGSCFNIVNVFVSATIIPELVFFVVYF